MNDAYAFNYTKRPDGSWGFTLDPWTPATPVPTPHLPPIKFTHDRRGRRARLARGGQTVHIDGPDISIRI